MSLPDRTCHMAYLTANDSTCFALDSLHFRNMAQLSPGVEKVEITIVVSRTRPQSKLQERALEALVGLAEASPWLSVASVIWKGNIGRDFSSARVGLAEIGRRAGESDYVMVRNRSAYGPITDFWFQRYIDQYERYAHTGLVGSTINLTGHPSRPETDDSRHVQTYVYLSQWRHLAPLIDDYPGSNCTDRLDVIEQGEIGLSGRIMKGGLGISCLYWPQHVFSESSFDDPTLPREDIKQQAVTLPFRYKYSNYCRNPAALFRQFVWICGLAANALLAPLRLRQAPQIGQVRRLDVGDYG